MFLLSTHIFLWYVSGDKRLPAEFRDQIQDPHNVVYFNVVSYWEIIVKYQLGKLPLPSSPDEFILQQRRLHQFDYLNLDEVSVTQLLNLPILHRDPFDRMLMCQAVAHSLTMVTLDNAILQYPIKTLQLN
jgi:PIN domain nuclease of toxin-antitoxin system